MERESCFDDEVTSLIVGVKDGDREAIELFLTKYRPLLLDNIRKAAPYLNGSVLGREDLEQEAATIAIELAREFDFDAIERFGSYLKQKLRWRIINYVRRERNKMRRSTELDDSIRESLAEEPLGRTSSEISSPRLRSAIKRLSPKQKSVLFKMYWQDKAADEVASELNVTDESVRALRRRAEERIRRLW